MAIVLLVVAGIVFALLSLRADQRAWKRRANRLKTRPLTTLGAWHFTKPTADTEAIERVLTIISKCLEVPKAVLRPGDAFDGELSLKDRFFCLVVDDDTIECLCDALEDEFGTRPKGKWCTLHDVVIQFARCPMSFET